jgi:hypothetical protein
LATRLKKPTMCNKNSNKKGFMRDLMLVIIGVVLGFVASFCIVKYQECIQRKKAIEICRIDILKVEKFISPMIKAYNDSKTVSMTNIPNFTILSQSDILFYLDNDIRKLIIDAMFDIDMAEEIRKINFSSNDLSKENLQLLNNTYFEYLKDAQLKIKNIKSGLD